MIPNIGAAFARSRKGEMISALDHSVRLKTFLTRVSTTESLSLVEFELTCSYAEKLMDSMSMEIEHAINRVKALYT